MTTFIIARNIHTGGGKTLLDCILRELKNMDDFYLYLDKRYKLPLNVDSNNLKKINPNFFFRFVSEFSIYKNIKKGDSALFFDNLPPILKLASHTKLFLQNRYLIDASNTPKSFKFKIILYLKKLWFRVFLKNIDEIIVQTMSMKIQLQKNLGLKKPITVMPFLSFPYRKNKNLSSKPNKIINDLNFLYVASGEAHKNHIKLINAWCLLANDGFFPKLSLTLDEQKNKKLLKWINTKAVQNQLNLINHGNVPYAEINYLYDSSDVLIYPSLLESFGLPLIESKNRGIPIIASELDYVRDLVDPIETFDPYSGTSICRAVKRYLNIKNEFCSLYSTKDFLLYLGIKLK